MNKEIEFKKIHQKTDGQADSALLLIESIDNDNPILIHSADCILDKSTEIKISVWFARSYLKLITSQFLFLDSLKRIGSGSTAIGLVTALKRGRSLWESE